MRVENIVFMQGDNANEALNIYDEQGVTALFEHLKQWHYPNEHEIREELSAGISDRTFNFGQYVLTVNNRYGYCGLEYILK